MTWVKLRHLLNIGSAADVLEYALHAAAQSATEAVSVDRSFTQIPDAAAGGVTACPHVGMTVTYVHAMQLNCRVYNQCVYSARGTRV